MNWKYHSLYFEILNKHSLNQKASHLFVTLEWNSEYNFILIIFIKLNLLKSRLHIKFWENQNIMKVSDKISIVR